MIPLVRLGNVAKVLKGRVPAKTIEDGTGARFFGIAEISGHPPRIVEPGIDLSQAIFLRKGDVVVALLGDLGKSAIVNHSGEGAVLGWEYAALRVSDPESPTYLAYGLDGIAELQGSGGRPCIGKCHAKHKCSSSC